MKKMIIYMLNIILITSLFLPTISTDVKAKRLVDVDDYNITMKRDILCLMMGYPEHVVNVTKDSNDKVYIVMKSGKKILYDDRKEKTQDNKFAFPDLQDMLQQLYPLSPITNVMEKVFDPGRIRVYELLSEVYGGSKRAVENNLTNVRIGGKRYQFNKSNNAANSLETVIKEVSNIGKANGNVWRYVSPANGTFNYRVIAGSGGRLSAHAFAIAIDLTSDPKDYWKWATPEQGTKRIQSYPKELVKLFEDNNFIWGGKWGHFDILHFEYRPEIILKAKYFSEPPKEGAQWYAAVPIEDNKVKEAIKIIDDTLK